MTLTVDEVLEKVGSLGFYQIRLIIIITFIEWINMASQITISSFVGAEPPWHCVSNATDCTLVGSFRPGMKNFELRCKIPRNQWEFEDDFTSVVTEYDLVCDKTYLASLSSSMVFAGWLIAALIGGFVGDRFGRRPIVYIAAVTISVWGFASGFPRVLWMYIVARLLVGLSRGFGNGGEFIILTEYTGIRHRHFAGTCMWFAWPAAILLNTGISFATRDWRIHTIIIGALGLPIVFVWWFLPESSRYLLVKGEYKRCQETLREIARVNKRYFPDEPLEDPTSSNKTNLRLGDFRDLFSSWSYIHKTLVMWVTWITVALVSFGVYFTISDLGGNMYMSYLIISAVDIPGAVIGIYCMGRFGRKKTQILSLIVASVGAIGAVLLTMYDPGNHKGFQAGRIIAACIGYSSSGIAFDTVYVFNAELFPTTHRGFRRTTRTTPGSAPEWLQCDILIAGSKVGMLLGFTKPASAGQGNIAMGTSTAIARIGAISAPFVAALNRIHVLLPYGVFGAMSLFAGCLCMTLPETKGVPLAETLENIPEKKACSNKALELDECMTNKDSEPNIKYDTSL